MTMDFVRKLVAKYPAIGEVWLYGSRANEAARPDSDWDYLAFADEDTLADLSRDTDLDRSNIDLMVVTDGVHFAKPWVDASGQKTGTLEDDLSAGGLAWLQLSPSISEYQSLKSDPADKTGFRSIIRTLRGRRVYP